MLIKQLNTITLLLPWILEFAVTSTSYNNRNDKGLNGARRHFVNPFRNHVIIYSEEVEVATRCESCKPSSYDRSEPCCRCTVSSRWNSSRSKGSCFNPIHSPCSNIIKGSCTGKLSKCLCSKYCECSNSCLKTSNDFCSKSSCGRNLFKYTPNSVSYKSEESCSNLRVNCGRICCTYCKNSKGLNREELNGTLNYNNETIVDSSEEFVSEKIPVNNTNEVPGTPNRTDQLKSSFEIYLTILDKYPELALKRANYIRSKNRFHQRNCNLFEIPMDPRIKVNNTKKMFINRESYIGLTLNNTNKSTISIVKSSNNLLLDPEKIKDLEGRHECERDKITDWKEWKDKRMESNSNIIGSNKTNEKLCGSKIPGIPPHPPPT
ncbi:hypothetical protein HWI79_1538 [Cryptosporidium felis]|nr:hypothetical protein HWI79_1538 [Cryptosporidium felis]